MTAAARLELWAKAEALRSPSAGRLDVTEALKSPRAKALALRLAETRSIAAPLSLQDVAAAPDWATWSAQRRTRLATLAGAVAISSSLSRVIAGDVLLRVAQALGATTLDAVLALGEDTPSISDRAALTGDADALARLGAAALLAEVGRPALRIRLMRLFADVAPGVADEDGAAVAGIARGLFAQVEGSAS